MKKLIATVLALTMALNLAACGAPAESTDDSSETTSTGENEVSDEKVRTLQLGHIDPSVDTDAYHIFALSFKEHLEELSGGTLKVDVFGDAQLGGEIEMYEAMTLGDLDMALITNNYYVNFVKDFQVFDMPFMFSDYEEVRTVVDDEEIFGYLQNKLLETSGIRLLTYADSGFRYIVNNRNPIASVSDLKGLKIRLPETAMYVNTFQALGANPTTMAFSEAYTAVQQGTVDGLEITASAIYSGGYYEICKYLSKTSHFCSPITLDMSEAVWQTLSEEQQGWVMEAAVAARDESRVKVQENEQVMLDEMADAGCQINEINDVKEFQKAVEPVEEAVRAEIGDEFLDMVLTKLGR